MRGKRFASITVQKDPVRKGPLFVENIRSDTYIHIIQTPLLPYTLHTKGTQPERLIEAVCSCVTYTVHAQIMFLRSLRLLCPTERKSMRFPAAGGGGVVSECGRMYAVWAHDNNENPNMKLRLVFWTTLRN